MKILIVLMALAACSATNTPAPVENRLPPEMNDSCGALRYHTLLDQDATALERVLILGEVRIIRSNGAVTQDYRLTRINFHVGEDGKITQISCG